MDDKKEKTKEEIENFVNLLNKKLRDKKISIEKSYR